MRKTHGVLFFVLGSHLLFAQPELAELTQALQQKLKKIVTEYELPGMNFSLVLDEDYVINLASGFSDIKVQTPMKPNDRMFAGSVGKIFVSAIVLQFVSEGKLQLEDLVADHLKSEDWYTMIPNHVDLRIKNLLNHTSGIPRYVFQKDFIEDLKQYPYKSRSPQECLQFIVGQQAVHPVGKGWGYSDTNYLLLGLILEKISGRTYYELLQDRMLSPFNLKQTIPSDQPQIPGLITGYVGKQNIFELPNKVMVNSKYVLNPDFEWTGGGVITTPGDLARWIKMLHENRILEKSVYEQLIDPVNMKNGKPFDQGYGLGTFVWSKQNDTRYGHSGFFPGYLSHVEYSSHKQYALAIQINHDGGFANIQQYIFEFDQIISQYLNAFDEYKIAENFKMQEQCWNQGDFQCYMNAYATDDMIQTISRGGVTKGYEKILNNYKKYFPKDHMGILHFDNLAFRRLDDHLYFVTGRFNLQFSNREDPASGWFSVVAKKNDGEWYLITDHSG